MMGIVKKTQKYILRSLYRRKFRSCGNNFRWDPRSSVFAKPGCAEIGSNVFLGEGFHISVHTSLKIGDGVIVGPRLIIVGGDHKFEEVGKRLHGQKGGIDLPVTIERDVWIGAAVTILKGVTIGEGAVIGAGSLVTKSVPPYTIAFGHPAKPVKKRFTDEELLRHLEILQYDRQHIDKIIEARNGYYAGTERSGQPNE